MRVVDVVDEEEVEEVNDEEVVDDREDVVVVDVVTGGMQQLLASHFQSSVDKYRSLHSCAFWHIIVSFEQLPPTWWQVEQAPYFK
jgi:hypothetical protein